MKYIIIPILKFTYAIVITVVTFVLIVIGQIIHFLWEFKFINAWSDAWVHDPNPDCYKGTHFYKNELVYKTVWHWLFNGNFKNLD